MHRWRWVIRTRSGSGQLVRPLRRRPVRLQARWLARLLLRRQGRPLRRPPSRLQSRHPGRRHSRSH